MDLTTHWHTGDAVTIMRTLPAESVDLILTSPPFLALRSYLPDDHPDKAVEVGSEPTPGAYVDTILDMVVEARRVLAPHGSLVVELGDTYANSGDGWPMAKSLSLIPEAVRFALAYGRNPHTGRVVDPWRIRNVVRWVRPNPPVGALGDKFRPATSEMLVACVSGDRYFDLDAVRTPVASKTAKYEGQRGSGPKKGNPNRADLGLIEYNNHPAGAPPLDWWEVTSQPYAESHYAVWPPKLLTRLVQSMCPKRVCVTCGEPSRRITEPDNGWSDCSHGNFRCGVILDPYAGTGTTLQVASGHGFSSIGIDLDERNTELAEKRIGMFLEMRS